MLEVIYFDITTNNVRKKNYIENYLKLNSRANKYLILITPNKGRDILPFIMQMKNHFKKYRNSFLYTK